MDIQVYKNIASALVRLMAPMVEVVIHNLESNTILFIEGNLSGRKIGDPSMINRTILEEDLHTFVYHKFHTDGRLVKSISVALDNNLLMCINCDISIVATVHEFTQQLLQQHNTRRPKSLFKDEWQDKIITTVHAYIQQRIWNFKNLNSKQKKEIVIYLFKEGAFNQKNAADYIAQVLDMGRATVFNYIKEVK